MIFVCVGASRPFDRLIIKMDEIASKGQHFFLAQIGSGTFKPKYMKFFRYMAHQEIIKNIALSDLVITHGGFGTIFDCLKLGTKIISVPKTFENDETDNDQTETVKYLEKRGLLDGVYSLEEMEEKIRIALATKVNPVPVKFNKDITKCIDSFMLSQESKIARV